MLAKICRKEPREGQRLTLAVRLDTPAGPLEVYSVHLEVFCGATGRLQQFADILEHSRAAAAHGVAHQIIGGDLNTMGHGIARLSPYHCTDSLRWATVGQTEAEFWQQNLFDVPEDPKGLVRVSGAIVVSTVHSFSCLHMQHLNIMGHCIARLSPYHCRDRLRWATMGQTEAEIWQQNLCNVVKGLKGLVRISGATRRPSGAFASKKAVTYLCGSVPSTC